MVSPGPDQLTPVASCGQFWPNDVDFHLDSKQMFQNTMEFIQAEWIQQVFLLPIAEHRKLIGFHTFNNTHARFLQDFLLLH